MYASSFVLALKRIETTLQRALALDTFEGSDRATRLADEAIAAAEDVGELTSVALPNVAVPGLERVAGDDAVRAILTARLEEGADAALPHDAVDRAHEAGRIVEVGGAVIVPVGEEMPAVRNWWLLASLLRDRLEGIVDGFQRVHRRAATDAPDPVETAFWTVVERLAALAEALSEALAVGRYTRRSVRQGVDRLLEGIGGLATAVTGGEHA